MLSIICRRRSKFFNQFQIEKFTGMIYPSIIPNLKLSSVRLRVAFGKRIKMGRYKINSTSNKNQAYKLA